MTSFGATPVFLSRLEWANPGGHCAEKLYSCRMSESHLKKTMPVQKAEAYFSGAASWNPDEISIWMAGKEEEEGLFEIL